MQHDLKEKEANVSDPKVNGKKDAKVKDAKVKDAKVKDAKVKDAKVNDKNDLKMKNLANKIADKDKKKE